MNTYVFDMRHNESDCEWQEKYLANSVEEAENFIQKRHGDDIMYIDVFYRGTWDYERECIIPDDN